MKSILLVAMVAMTAVTTACDDTDPVWQLENDRIIAVRATPPQMSPGERSTIEVLVTSIGRGPFVIAPQIAIATPADATTVVPALLSKAIVAEGTTWTVVAPDAAALRAVRTEMGLAADAPVPLRIGIRVDLGSGPLDAVKTVTFGTTVNNPSIGVVTIGGAPAQDGIVIPVDTDVELRVDAGVDDEVVWLTSIGDLSDFDDPIATVRHKRSSDDLTSGHIAVVVRDPQGGVTWGFWTASIAQ
jgi:hypothetical protein